MGIRYQIQFYTTNDLLIHPIVSPALAYLGRLAAAFFCCEWVRGAQERDCMRVCWLQRRSCRWVALGRSTDPKKYASDAVRKSCPE